MVPGLRHRWDLTPKEAIALQRRIAARVCRQDDFGEVHTVAGVDAAFHQPARLGFAAVALFSLPQMELMETVQLEGEVTFPYVPGLLSFREAPLLARAVRKLRRRPDLLICDGQGYAHPRRLGIASHLGLVLDLPSIGCAKSRLVGEEAHPGPNRGDAAPLLDKGEVIGMVLRTRNNVRPLYVSTGHRVSLEGAVDFVLRCGDGYRLPAPTRRADFLAGELKRRVLGRGGNAQQDH